METAGKSKFRIVLRILAAILGGLFAIDATLLLVNMPWFLTSPMDSGVKAFRLLVLLVKALLAFFLLRFAFRRNTGKGLHADSDVRTVSTTSKTATEPQNNPGELSSTRHARSENDAYEIVARELRDGLTNEGLWLKAKVVSENEASAKKLYVKYRVEALLEGQAPLEVDEYKVALERAKKRLDFDPKEEARKISKKWK